MAKFYFLLNNSGIYVLSKHELVDKPDLGILTLIRNDGYEKIFVQKIVS